RLLWKDRLSSDLPFSPVPRPHKEVGHHDNRYIAARWTDFGQVGHHHARLSDAIERPNATWACPAHIAESVLTTAVTALQDNRHRLPSYGSSRWGPCGG